jgi:hypothetical protein
MKKKILLIPVIAGLLLCSGVSSNARWGFYAHKRINYMAVFTLPEPMIGFYKKHITYLSAHAVDPDRRRYASAAEGPKHFLDSDHYGLHPFDSIPRKWNEAVMRYGLDSLKAHGILPWNIVRMMYRLSRAFQEGDEAGVLHCSADLGHYIADAHVPLHTTANYNGQFSNQRGIHAFWESRIPELKGEGYDYLAGKAEYLDKPGEKAWAVVQASFSAKDSVLGMEAQLNARFPPDLKYSIESHGSQIQKVYSEAYAEAYNQLLGNMVERRMREAIRTVGSFWYTAWVLAGQPDLEHFGEKVMLDSLKKESEEGYNLPDSLGH